MLQQQLKIQMHKNEQARQMLLITDKNIVGLQAQLSLIEEIERENK